MVQFQSATAFAVLNLVHSQGIALRLGEWYPS